MQLSSIRLPFARPAHALLAALLAAALLSACSGTGEPTRVAAPGSRNGDATASAPVVYGLSPMNGPTTGGNTVTIIGASLQGTSTQVTVNGQPAPITSISSTQIEFTMLAGEGGVPVGVTTDVGSSTPIRYTYDAPAITSIVPSSGPAAGGTNVTLSGNDFGLNPTVTFDAAQATILSHNHTEIILTSPAGTPGVQSLVRVTVGGQVSNAVNFAYGAPSIAALTPAHGPTSGGTSVVLLGTNFGTSSTVSFNGTPITPQSVTETQITFTTPPGQGTNVPIVVTSGTSHSNTVFFNYDAPSIASITPSSGSSLGGTSITIAGSNFGTATPTVTIGAASAPVTSATQSVIVATTPAGAVGQAAVVVNVASQSSNVASFTYTAQQPQILAISPATGPTAGGNAVTLTGRYFGYMPVVTVQGVTVGPFAGATDTQIGFPMPQGEGTVAVVVTTAGGRSNSVNYVYGPPSITSVSPASGSAAGGYPVTLTGNNFGLHPVVTFGGSSAAILSWNHTEMVVTAPAGMPGSSVPVVVSVAGQIAKNASFKYDAPTLSNLSPSHGPTNGGTVVTLSGASFGVAPQVLFGSAPAPIISASQTSITVQSPAGQGTASVVVASGSSRSQALTYTYDPPTIAGIAPSSGPVAGGTLVTISGANFGQTPIVTFGGTSASIAAASQNQLVVSTPAGAPTTVPVIVSVGGQSSNAASYQYLCPSGTVVDGNACVKPVVLLQDVVTALPPAAQTVLGPTAADVASKLADNNPNNNNGACGELNALSKQTAALLRQGSISASDANSVQRAIALSQGQADCR